MPTARETMLLRSTLPTGNTARSHLGTLETAGIVITESDIKTWVREELSTEMSRIDAPISDIPTAEENSTAVWTRTAP